MRTPTWFSRRYPTPELLEASIADLGALLQEVPGLPAAAIVFGAGAPVVFVPAGQGPLERCWSLAHELAHLLMHEGYISEWTHDQQEGRADRWAACALIPESAVLRHRNASGDAFVGALSAHYQDIPYEDCEERRLAGQIALLRLEAVEEVG